MLSDDEKERRKIIRNTRIATGAGNQIAQNTGMIDANTAQTVANLAGNPGKLGAAAVTGAVAVKGAAVAGAAAAAPFVVPVAIGGAIGFAGYKAFKWLTD